MNKNIIICSDGTGNTTIKNRGTNVFKLFEAIKTNNPTKPQIAIYDDGVGSATTKFSQIVGGAFGYGLSRNVKQLYLSLVRNYRPGDNIYLFGFSRGAFTVRSLAGMISYMGILDPGYCKTETELQAYVRHAYREYRYSKRAILETVLSWLFVTPILFYQRKFKKYTYLVSHKDFKQEFSVKQIIDENQQQEKKLIRFIGVWDTVSAVGFPIPWVTWLFNNLIYRYSFTDNDLNDDVEQACHALSIDDQRKTFHPEIWNEHNEADKKRIEQVWFAGVHSNVGGGYPKQGMSLVTLNWMMRKATNSGIEFISNDMQLYAEKQNVYDKLYDSRRGFSVYYRYEPRDIHKICEVHGITPVIHSSAINRLLQGTAGYAPGNINKGFIQEDISSDCCRWPNASEEISAALGDDTSMLKRVTPWYLIRKFSHGVFFIATIYAVYDFYSANHDTISKNIDYTELPLKLIQNLLTQGECLFGISCMLVIIALFYLLLRFAKEKMHDVYSAFYYELIKKQKNVIDK